MDVKHEIHIEKDHPFLVRDKDTTNSSTHDEVNPDGENLKKVKYVYEFSLFFLTSPCNAIR